MKKMILSVIIMCSILFPINVLAKEFNLNEDKVYLSGETIGLKLNTGVVITKLYSINKDGESLKPWEECNIMIDDIILKVNDINIVSSDSLIGVLKENGEKQCSLQILRDGKIISTHITPIQNENSISLGIYVKDNVMGVGTMTFITEEDLLYASLGHQITSNSNTNTGSIYKAEVLSIDKSSKGYPGSKKASIGKEIGDITLNSNKGIYGSYDNEINDLELMYISSKDEIKLGYAQIYTCIEGNDVEMFDINITNIYLNTTDDIKGIKFKITDENLLEHTGGVIQGMSGSPIIQNEKIIGAVTHVVVNTPEYGYGVFAENMLKELNYEIIK